MEVSWESPSWADYLKLLDKTMLQGMKDMILMAMSTLSTRAQLYEQVVINQFTRLSHGCDNVVYPQISSLYIL